MSLISKEIKVECVQSITLSFNHFGKTTAVILPQQGRCCFDKEPPPTYAYAGYELKMNFKIKDEFQSKKIPAV